MAKDESSRPSGSPRKRTASSQPDPSTLRPAKKHNVKNVGTKEDAHKFPISPLSNIYQPEDAHNLPTSPLSNIYQSEDAEAAHKEMVRKGMEHFRWCLDNTEELQKRIEKEEPGFTSIIFNSTPPL